MSDDSFGPLFLTVYPHIRGYVFGWLEKQGLDEPDFYAGFVNYCVGCAQRPKSGAKPAKEREALVASLRLCPLPYTDLVKSLEWYADNVYDRNGATKKGPIKLPGAQQDDILCGEYELYNRLFSVAERVDHNDSVMRTVGVLDGRRRARAERAVKAGQKRKREAEEEAGEQEEDEGDEEAFDLTALQTALDEAAVSREEWSKALTLRPKEQ